MASDAFKIEIGLLTPDAPHVVDILAVDRSILSDDDVKYILDELPEVEARIDSQSYKPYLGVDIFYGKDAEVKGLVFATKSRALVVRVPDSASEMSAALYEQKKAKAEASELPRAKGERRVKAVAPETTVYDRLRRLLGANLVAFGMAQISLTLWDTLHEKVEGVNLSTATTPPRPPPARIIPDSNPSSDEECSDPEQKSRKDGGGRGGKDRGRGGRGGDGGMKPQEPTQMKKTVKLPEDQKDNWDRRVFSPGDVVKKIYESVSRLDVNSTFIGRYEEIDMRSRVVEAVVRAWISSTVANSDEFNLVIQTAPVIKPSRLTDDELNFFSKSMVAAWKAMGEEGAGRVIEREDIEATGDDKIESKSRKSKIKPGKNQVMTITLEDGTQKLFYIRRPDEGDRWKRTQLCEKEDEEEEQCDSSGKGRPSADAKGERRGKGPLHRKGLLGDYADFSSDWPNPADPDLADPDLDPTTPVEASLFNPDEVEDISVYGREDATMPELARDAFILRLLEGRGAIRGPEYDDCEFIRRIWFPTPAQIATGQRRKTKNSPPVVQQRHGWIDDPWDDDTDEEEVAPQNGISNQNLTDSDTEDEDIGHNLQKNQIKPPALAERMNLSQLRVVGRIVAPNPRGRVRATLVHGPPGTGKTTTIAAAVILLANMEQPVWIAAQSNVGIRNVAIKLKELGYEHFILLVSKEHHVWTESEYNDLTQFVITTSDLPRPSEETMQRIQSAKMVLCTLAMLSNPMVERIVLPRMPLRNLIIEEASQIDMTSEFMHLFFKHRYALKNVCWFGDPMQLPPYGWSESRKINDIFKVEHLQANSKLLDISYRLPIPIARYISKAVYEGELNPFDDHKVKSPKDAIRFIDVSEGIEKREENGTSFMNDAEANLVVKIIQLYYDKVDPTSKEGRWYNYEIITPYEAQRRLVARKLSENGIGRDVFNVDSFQGNEADYIITTLTKTTYSSFLTSIHRLNVLLTRCKRGLVIVTQRDFVARTGGLLRGLSWSHDSHDIWASSSDVEKGYVDLPGSPAPNNHGSSEEESSEEEDE